MLSNYEFLRQITRAAFGPRPMLIDDPTNAAAKSRALLLHFLSPKQRKEFEKNQSFEVVGGNSGNVYRIIHAAQFNVLDTKTLQELCFRPSHTGCWIPDMMLAQKIMLENDEDYALRVANYREATRS